MELVPKLSSFCNTNDGFLKMLFTNNIQGVRCKGRMRSMRYGLSICSNFLENTTAYNNFKLADYKFQIEFSNQLGFSVMLAEA